MPKEFWAEAVACAAYISNRSPTKSLKDVMPQEEWNGWKPNVSHSRVFGSSAYVQVPEQERSKLDDQSKKVVFIGYDENSKGYKFFNPSNNKVIISRDVEFEEDATWDWSTKNETAYDFLPYFDEETSTQEVQDEIVSPMMPTSSSIASSSSSPSSSLSEDPQKYQSLEDLYEETKRLEDESLLCLYSSDEPLNFEEAMKDKKMDTSHGGGNSRH